MIIWSRQDVRSQIIELKRLLVSAIADEQKLYQRYSDADGEANRWKKRAEIAVGKGADDLAMGALARANQYASRAAEFERQYLEQKGYVERLKARLRALETGVGEPTSIVAGSSKRAEIALEALERMERREERAREQRAMFAAIAELERDELAEKLAALEQEDQLERQLIELKRRLGVLKG